MKYILNYSFKADSVSNPDGTASAQVTNCNIVAGPGQTEIGDFANALDFSRKGKLEVNLSYLPELPKFCFRVLLQSGKVEDRQIVLFCSGLPIRILFEKTAASAEVRLIVKIKHAQSGWSEVTTKVVTDTWLLLDVAFDMDTMAVFINNKLVGITAFSSVELAQANEQRLAIGWVDPEKEAFTGKMAALQIIDGIPENLENVLDAQRGKPEWHIRVKENQLGASINLGLSSGNPRKVENDTFFIQTYENGAIFFDPADGQSAEIHGPIFNFWKSKRALQNQLGNLLRDEMSAGKPGTRKSVFENGAIFWSETTGCVPIIGQKMFSDYVKMGESSNSIGLPLSPAVEIPGAYRQECQGGVLYYNIKATSMAALRGAIAAEYKKQGGHAKWGLPVTSDNAIVTTSGANPVTLGRMAEFAGNASIFQKKGASEAILLEGEFLLAYSEAGGPKGILGFPTAPVKSVGSINHAGFEAGAIVKIGSKILVVPSFNIIVKRVDTYGSEGVDILQDQNDLYMY